MAYNKRPMKGFATLQAQELNSRLVPSTSMAPEMGDTVPALIVEAEVGSGSDIAVTSDVVDRSADLLFFTFASDFDESVPAEGEAPLTEDETLMFATFGGPVDELEMVNRSDAPPVDDESLMYMTFGGPADGEAPLTEDETLMFATFGGPVDELEMVKRSDAPPVDDESLMYMTFGGPVDGEAPLTEDETLMFATCGMPIDGEAPPIDDETLMFASYGAPDEMSPVAEDLGFRPETDVPPNFRGPTLDDPSILENLADDGWAIIDDLGDDETLLDFPAVDPAVVDLIATSVPPTMADGEATIEVETPVELVSLDGVVPTVESSAVEVTDRASDSGEKVEVVAFESPRSDSEEQPTTELPEWERVDLVSFESFAKDDDSKK